MRADAYQSLPRTEDKKKFRGIYGLHIAALDTEAPISLQPVFNLFYRGCDDDKIRQRQRMALELSLFPDGWEKQVDDFLGYRTKTLVRNESWSLTRKRTNNVDVVRDVFIVRLMISLASLEVRC